MALLDLLGRRWTLRILWELRPPTSVTFRELQSRSGDISSSVLTARLKDLSEAGLVDHDGGYRLTARGVSLLELLGPLDTWARRWAHETHCSDDEEVPLD
jgi:DNA-binding HxlR family transcriptional regulator